jgi:hypothetical protein
MIIQSMAQIFQIKFTTILKQMNIISILMMEISDKTIPKHKIIQLVLQLLKYMPINLSSQLIKLRLNKTGIKS